jgi:ferric-dicitrate binding protein FerR (iron transport regulator)
MSRHSPKSSLRRLVRAARAEKPAELDWQRIEERLLQETRRATPPAVRSRSPWAWTALAAAALVAIWLVGVRTHVASPETRSARIDATDPLRRDGDAMAVGARLATTERAVTVDHAGRASWTLAPNSGARLADKAERITVQLERGSVLSRVVPDPKPETFVVEAAGTRVAVHGTVFRVALEGGRVVVHVSEGTVAVGPIGAAPSFLLKAPARGDFAADGRSGNVEGGPPDQREARRAAPLKAPRTRPQSATTASGVAAPAVSSELPNEPSINDIELGISRVVDVAADCFSQHIQSADGVQVTVHTALSLQIASSGVVSDIGFQPPLSPETERCAADGIARIEFAASKQGAKVTRLLELKR